MEYFCLTCKRELHAHSEILRHSGIAAAGEQGLRTLAVVVDAKGYHSADGVVNLRAGLDGLAAAGCFAETGLEVAFDGILIAEAEVKTKIQIMSKGALVAGGAGGRSRGLFCVAL